MTMQTDVKSQHVTASGNIAGLGRVRFKSMSYRGNGTDGYVKLRDGGASGTVFCELDVGTSDTFTIYVLMPGEGILFPNGIYLDISNVSAVTVFYG
jgi:hypothetical protein